MTLAKRVVLSINARVRYWQRQLAEVDKAPPPFYAAIGTKPPGKAARATRRAVAEQVIKVMCAMLADLKIAESGDDV